jgi:hypothetical protein
MDGQIKKPVEREEGKAPETAQSAFLFSNRSFPAGGFP